MRCGHYSISPGRREVHPCRDRESHAHPPRCVAAIYECSAIVCFSRMGRLVIITIHNVALKKEGRAMHISYGINSSRLVPVAWSSCAVGSVSIILSNRIRRIQMIATVPIGRGVASSPLSCIHYSQGSQIWLALMVLNSSRSLASFVSRRHTTVGLI